jgi:hypothetical protein
VTSSGANLCRGTDSSAALQQSAAAGDAFAVLNAVGRAHPNPSACVDTRVARATEASCIRAIAPSDNACVVAVFGRRAHRARSVHELLATPGRTVCVSGTDRCARSLVCPLVVNTRCAVAARLLIVGAVEAGVSALHDRRLTAGACRVARLASVTRLCCAALARAAAHRCRGAAHALATAAAAACSSGPFTRLALIGA